VPGTLLFATSQGTSFGEVHSQDILLGREPELDFGHFRRTLNYITGLFSSAHTTRRGLGGGVIDSYTVLNARPDLDIRKTGGEGEVVSCPECGSDFEVITANPIALKP